MATASQPQPQPLCRIGLVTDVQHADIPDGA